MNNIEQLERLVMANIKLSSEEQKVYLQHSDELPPTTSFIPKGYKKCRKCGAIKKLYLFNRNSQAKDNCTTQCKECQKKNAHKSYAKNKHKRKYKEYYQKHKELKQEQSRKYYMAHKEEMLQKHKQYHASAKGRKVMKKAHMKRAELLKAHTGIPYTREMVIERDSLGGPEPICYLCGKPITGTPHLDHVIPVVMGGLDCFTNVACVHDICNLSKSKDGREITVEQVTRIEQLANQYIEEHPEQFPDLFEGNEE